MNLTSLRMGIALGLGALALAPPSWARNAAVAGRNQCRAAESQVIDSENRCFQSGGINIDYYQDDGIKVACMQDKRVRAACGPDGQLTRLHAYAAWFTKL